MILSCLSWNEIIIQFRQYIATILQCTGPSIHPSEHLPRKTPMCGIVGAVSTRNIVPILIEGLKRLEYRGYDSCGVAVHQNGQLRRARSTSRVAGLEAQLRGRAVHSGTGIAHTRWAAHGA